MAQRQQILQAELKRMIGVLKKRYHPERIILFGSLVAGRIHAWSDIDLVVIKKTKKQGVDRLLEIAELCKNRIATHFLVYTPAEYKRLSADKDSFLANEVLSKGKILYP